MAGNPLNQAHDSDQAAPEASVSGNSLELVPPFTNSIQLKRLYRTQYQQLRNYLRKLLGMGPPDPEDVAQTAFAKLAARKDLDDIDNLSAFLWRTAQNIVMSEHRASAVRNKRAQDVKDIYSPERADGCDPERVLIAETEIETVLAVLKTMPERKRQILMLSRIDGLKNAEIARRLGLSRSTVSEHLARAMLELDQALNEFEGDQ